MLIDYMNSPEIDATKLYAPANYFQFLKIVGNYNYLDLLDKSANMPTLPTFSFKVLYIGNIFYTKLILFFLYRKQCFFKSTKCARTVDLL